MNLERDAYYHIYNRSNNSEVVFKSPENYLYFLQKYRQHLSNHFQTLAYCLMPTHFHFLVQIKHNDVGETKNRVGIWLSSYTKAINKRFVRHGSLFQHHTKAKPVNNDRYLLTLVTYIHQNPVRRRLVNTPGDWPYSSYLDYAGLRGGTLPAKDLVYGYFHGVEEFIQYSQIPIRDIDTRYWV